MSEENQQLPDNPPVPTTPNKIIVKTRYTYDVFQRGFYIAPMFHLMFEESDPDLVNDKANKLLAQNVADPKLFTLQIRSIEALEAF